MAVYIRIDTEETDQHTVDESASSESYAYIQRAGDELFELFQANPKWTWMGEQPTRDQIGWKLLTLMFLATRSLVNTDKLYTEVSTGRITAKATKFDSKIATVTFHLDFAVGG